MSQFEKPDFSEGALEFRIVDNEVCIYGTEQGLEKLIEFCGYLIKKGKGHIHLEDYEVLTKKSEIAVLAIFEENK